MNITSAVSRSDIIRKFRRSKTGVIGAAILMGLIITTIYTVVAVPLESFREWNNPNYWIDLPRAAAPTWTNFGFGPKLPEHIVMKSNDASISTSSGGGMRTIVHSFTIEYDYDSYPDDFMIPYAVKYGSTPPALQVSVTRPDGREFEIYLTSLPSSQGIENSFSGRVFSTDMQVADNLRENADIFSQRKTMDPQEIIFSDTQQERVLKGQYLFRETFYLFESGDSVVDSGIILGGKVYGLMGTDELRRNLAIGILWGTPVALFIGLTVAIAAVLVGLIYGVVAVYKGNRTDEGLMRLNDLFYSLPALPLLIILSVTVGRSIFLITGFLLIFAWVGMAKISRSMALQIKSFQYVEAAKLMGQSDSKIIFKHIIPQLLPFTFASIALAVPSAILTEASLSFLGLGDPSIPTWGQILNEAHSSNAVSNGLWWWILPPGMMIALTGLSFALIGIALDSIVNPRAKRK